MHTFDFLSHAKYFLVVSFAAVTLSLLLLVVPGPRFSIEFTGGTRMEITVPADRATADVEEAFASFATDLGPTVNRIQNGNFVVRLRGLDDETHKAVLAHIPSSLGEVSEVQYTTIGPTVGKTLKLRAIYALLVASLGIVVFLAFAFRKIPRKYNPWKFGVVAVCTLLHDVIIVCGIFTILSIVTDFEIDTLFVTALLTILGYSVNDTIVVFDRIRDNIFIQERKEEFATLANRSIQQTWKRSTYTGASTLIMLLALFLLGSVSIKWFILTLICGIVIGTYSSIFVATPLLVLWNKRKSM